MTEFPNEATRTIVSLLIVFISLLLPTSAPSQLMAVKEVRAGSDPAYARLVIETNQAFSVEPKIALSRRTLRITLPGSLKIQPAVLANVRSGDFVRLDSVEASNATYLEAIYSFSPADIKIFTLTDPHRLVVDAYRPTLPAADDPKDSANASVRSANENTMQSSSATAADTDRSRIQQRLLGILIVVTSILLVVIIFLMCMDKFRK